jgi:hypothetical protein
MDHFLVFLKIDLPVQKTRSPFKYNPGWFLEDDFKALVK